MVYWGIFAILQLENPLFSHFLEMFDGYVKPKWAHCDIYFCSYVMPTGWFVTGKLPYGLLNTTSADRGLSASYWLIVEWEFAMAKSAWHMELEYKDWKDMLGSWTARMRVYFVYLDFFWYFLYPVLLQHFRRRRTSCWLHWEMAVLHKCCKWEARYQQNTT